MGRRALIDKGLLLAFKQLGDLKERAEFVSTTSTFDAATLETVGTDSSVFASVVPLEKDSKTAEGKSATKLSLLVRSREVPSIVPFAFVRFRGKQWRIGDSITDSGYILQFEVYLE